MALWKPDPTFYASPRLAGQAPPEELDYVVTLNPNAAQDGKPDALVVVDTNPASPTYAQTVGRLEMPNVGDELHHFNWNACSAALCPYAPHPHVERRYLLVPGLRSSRIYVIEVKADPRRPQIVKTIEAAEIANKTGYSRPHTFHCGPDGIYVSALGDVNGDGPGGIFILRLRVVRRAGALGGGPGAAVPRLRLLVAPGLRHGHHQRVGDAQHGRGRREPRTPADGQVRPPHPPLGPAPPQAFGGA